MSAKCPRCDNTVEQLVPVDDVVKSIAAKRGESSLPENLCENCFSEFASPSSRAGVLLMKEKAREQRKLNMWKGRVHFVKNARLAMKENNFTEAAISYEKYLRTLEAVFDKQSGELSPQLFKESARTAEITVVAAAYWDLLRIYDTSSKHADRMEVVALKLADFLRYSPIFPDIIRKAEIFQKRAKKPDIIKLFLKASQNKRPRCFIATSAFSNPYAHEVQLLAWYRDFSLAKNYFGKLFIQIYYLISPFLAFILDRNQAMKPAVRIILNLIIRLLKLK
jgi:hypothetical protein